ncbi:hypothetical protein QVD17_13929 [Tagetes erecta]|uniref:C3H1-type domain-containing protein n=1 Tax=Tagetes erecta TaxID=13708 RepID=A0AAD8NWF0_TARER|nr:hypothetical protein QVD17_13929 [Tagetes erecta]
MMMIIGRDNFHSNPTIQIPPWDDPTDHIHSPTFINETEMAPYDDVSEFVSELDDIPIDAFASDHFRMYEFKVRRCARARSHDWTECPFAHPGEKARRRDPRKFHYSGNPCPEFRKGCCNKGETCEYAHGVFECWLHPVRYRTQPCKDGVMCRRRICFFAHTAEQLRVLPVSRSELTQCDSYDGSPSRFSIDSFIGKSLIGSSPTSTLYSSCSPPLSPVGQTSVNELASSVRNLQISNGICNGVGNGNGVRLGSGRSLSMLRPGYTSLPTTPTRNPTRNVFDAWEEGVIREEPVMERVESGKEIRAKMYAKLSRENSLAGRVDSGGHDGWVSELVK